MTTVEASNTLFPGRGGYFGPLMGVFGLLHHDLLCELSHNVNERVMYVRHEKPVHEQLIRLYNMIYLGDCAAAAVYCTVNCMYHVELQELEIERQATRQYGGFLSEPYFHPSIPSRDEGYANKLVARYRAQCAVLEPEIMMYIKTHIPNCPWNGEKLVMYG